MAYWWSQDGAEPAGARGHADASSGLTVAERRKLREQLSHPSYRSQVGVSGLQVEVSAGDLPARASHR